MIFENVFTNNVANKSLNFSFKFLTSNENNYER